MWQSDLLELQEARQFLYVDGSFTKNSRVESDHAAVAITYLTFAKKEKIAACINTRLESRFYSLRLDRES